MLNRLRRFYMNIDKSLFFIGFLLFFVLIFLLSVSLGRQYALTNEYRAELEEVQQERDLILAEKSDLLIERKALKEEMSYMANERDLNAFTEELITRYIANNQTIDLIRNEILHKNPDMCVDRAGYQAMWIYTASKENDVDPLLLLAVGIKENNLRHRVNGEVTVNSKNAQGMFQITPIVESIYNMNALVFEENVKMSAKFLSKQLERYNDVDLALAHYNAGSNAHTALQSYPETIDYVAEITKFYNTFKEVR